MIDKRIQCSQDVYLKQMQFEIESLFGRRCFNEVSAICTQIEERYHPTITQFFVFHHALAEMFLRHYDDAKSAFKKLLRDQFLPEVYRFHIAYNLCLIAGYARKRGECWRYLEETACSAETSDQLILAQNLRCKFFQLHGDFRRLELTVLDDNLSS